MTQFWNFMLWVVYPYLMLGSFFIGTVVRMRKPGSVTAKSSELMEKKRLIWGSILFHIGILGVFGGHVIGIFIPETFTDSIGITNEFYHKVLAMGIGGVFGAMTLVGIIVLTYRRFTSKRVAATSTLNDNVVIVALLVTIVLGMMSSFWAGPMTPGFDYRTTIGVWGRGLFAFSPAWNLMNNIPLFYKLHIICGLAMFGFFPYTRLVHALYVPLHYIFRRFVVYRRYSRR